MHNFFVTVTNFRNRPLFFSSAGKVSLGRNKKQKISIQAVEEICSSISRHVIERGYNRSVNVLFKSFFLNKRIKLALKALSQGGLRIRKLIDISPKPHNSGLRLSKTRRI